MHETMESPNINTGNMTAWNSLNIRCSEKASISIVV